MLRLRLYVTDNEELNQGCRLYIGIKSLSLSKGLLYRCLSDKLCTDIWKVDEVELTPKKKIFRKGLLGI